MQKVIAKIHLGNIRRNAEKFSALTGKPLCAVVKANAYGHGAEEVVNALESVVDCFAVALIEEAIEIRAAACGKDILIFTPPLDEVEVLSIAQNAFTATIPNVKTAKLIANVCQKWRLSLRVHLKINTGMNRYGMDICTLGKVCKLLQGNAYVRVEGIYSHLYEYTYESAKKQRALFLKNVALCHRYFPKVRAHLGGTYGGLLGRDFCLDMTRVGIGLYGYLPDGIDTFAIARNENLCLEKGMEIYAKVIENRGVSYGGAGYGKHLSREEMQALKRLYVERFGYADGFLRQRCNGVQNFENNVNNLCMDVCLRKGNAKRGDWLPVMTDAAQTAKLTGTITHEVLCAATRRAEFLYDDE